MLMTSLSFVACQSARMQFTHDGKETWRSDRLSFDRAGGSLTIRVLGASGHRVTVFLLGQNDHERLLDFVDVDPLAVGTGHIGDDGFKVRFTELPAGRYRVGAFEDRDRDGALVVEQTFDGPVPNEPHAATMIIEVDASSSHELDLTIEGDAS